MGYRVGQICYGTQIEAQNHVMSQVIPTIDKDGVLNHPVFYWFGMGISRQSSKNQLSSVQ